MAATSSPTDRQFQILTASLEDVQVPVFLRNKLQQCLPHSLPLYRRCQFYLDQRKRQNTTDGVASPRKREIWVALSRCQQTSALFSASDEWLQPWLAETTSESQSEPSSPQVSSRDAKQPYWIAAHIDLTEPGQTQVWIFGSWESTHSPDTTASSTRNSTLATTTPETISQKYALFQAFYQRLRADHIPHLPLTPSPQWLAMKASGKIVSVPYNRNKVLFGTISEALWWMHEDWVVHDRGIPKHLLHAAPNSGSETIPTTNATIATPSSITREDRPYLKYLLPLSHPPTIPPAPPGFRFSPLQPPHLQLMLDRSPIPRALELLRTLVSVGLFPAESPDPVAWGILSPDASVGSLHTEPVFRGRGFAEAVTRALMALIPTRFGDGHDGVGLGHTDVSPANGASRRVFEKMGGVVGWRVAWVEVDVGLGEK